MTEVRGRTAGSLRELIRALFAATVRRIIQTAVLRSPACAEKKSGALEVPVNELVTVVV